MKLIFGLYVLLGLGTGMFLQEEAAKATLNDWLILLGINSPLILLTLGGAYVAAKKGKFLDMPLPIWLFACLACYGVGIGMFYFT